jgi:hypothetical protein
MCGMIWMLNNLSVVTLNRLVQIKEKVTHGQG